MEELINDRYKVIGKLGEGAFGAVYQCSDLKNPTKQLVVKVEKQKRHVNHLAMEERILRALKGITGFPRCYGLFSEHGKRFMVLQRLGKSITQHYNELKQPFNLKTIVCMAFQLIQLLEELHNKDYIHRDLKPENIMTGFVNQRQLYLIDFGVSKKYRDSTTGLHVPWNTNKNLTGTARYASINSHKGFEISRRDDIVSIQYILVYLYRGFLPWQGMVSKKKSGQFLKILEAKISTKPADLFQDMPPEFPQILQYAYSLEFEDTPDYNYIYSLLNKVSDDFNITADNNFQWIAKKRRGNKSEVEAKRERSMQPMKISEAAAQGNRFSREVRRKPSAISAFELAGDINQEGELCAPSPYLGSFIQNSKKSNLSFVSGSFMRSLAPHGSWQEDASNMTTENVYPEFSPATFNKVR